MPDLKTKQPSAKACFNAAVRLLSRRDHSQHELAQKLKERGFTDDQIVRAVERCLGYAYLDDERYAHDHVRRLQRKGYGVHRIRESMRAKGFDRRLRDSIIAHHCTRHSQLAQCRRIMNKKLKSTQALQPGKPIKPRLYRYLLSRGFSASIVKTVLDSAVDNRSCPGMAEQPGHKRT